MEEAFVDQLSKAGHEPARAGLGASRSLARSKMARLGLARLSHESEKGARLELASDSVQLDLAREPSIKNNDRQAQRAVLQI
jgi:hypothetical protein